MAAAPQHGPEAGRLQQPEQQQGPGHERYGARATQGRPESCREGVFFIIIRSCLHLTRLTDMHM